MIPGTTTLPGDERFFNLLQQMAELHSKKTQDYGRGEDPLANLRGCEEWGVEAWRGVLLRMGDKFHRLKSYALTGKLANEGVEDTLLDIANYSLLCLILHREAKEKAK